MVISFHSQLVKLRFRKDQLRKESFDGTGVGSATGWRNVILLRRLIQKTMTRYGVSLRLGWNRARHMIVFSNVPTLFKKPSTNCMTHHTRERGLWEWSSSGHIWEANERHTGVWSKDTQLTNRGLCGLCFETWEISLSFAYFIYLLRIFRFFALEDPAYWSPAALKSAKNSLIESERGIASRIKKLMVMFGKRWSWKIHGYMGFV